MADRSGAPPASDPFRMTADPSAYVARGSTERVLEWVEERVRSAPDPVLLCGPPGVGKTLLLRVIAERLGVDFETLYLPYPMLSPAEMWAWIEEALSSSDGASGRDDNPTRPLLLLVDSAESLPISTARSLAAATRIEHAGVRLVMALVDGEFARALSRALGSNSTTVHLADDMSDHELETYVRRRLEQVGAGSAEQERFDRETLEQLHRESHGNPARVHELADSVLRGREIESLLAENVEEGTALEGGSAAEEIERAGEWGGAHAAEEGSVPGAALEPFAPAEGRRRIPDLLTQFPVWVALATVGVLLVASLWMGDGPRGDGEAGSETPSGSAASGAAAVLPAAALPTEMIPVNINAQPWALIEVDGVPVGETPIADLPTRPGVHRFSAHLPDGRVVHQVVEVTASSRHIAFR